MSPPQKFGGLPSQANKYRRADIELGEVHDCATFMRRFRAAERGFGFPRYGEYIPQFTGCGHQHLMPTSRRLRNIMLFAHADSPTHSLGEPLYHNMRRQRGQNPHQNLQNIQSENLRAKRTGAKKAVFNEGSVEMEMDGYSENRKGSGNQGFRGLPYPANRDTGGDTEFDGYQNSATFMAKAQNVDQDFREETPSGGSFQNKRVPVHICAFKKEFQDDLIQTGAWKDRGEWSENPQPINQRHQNICDAHQETHKEKKVKENTKDSGVVNHVCKVKYDEGESVKMETEGPSDNRKVVNHVCKMEFNEGAAVKMETIAPSDNRKIYAVRELEGSPNLANVSGHENSKVAGKEQSATFIPEIMSEDQVSRETTFPVNQKGPGGIHICHLPQQRYWSMPDKELGCFSSTDNRKEWISRVRELEGWPNLENVSGHADSEDAGNQQSAILIPEIMSEDQGSRETTFAVKQKGTEGIHICQLPQQGYWSKPLKGFGGLPNTAYQSVRENKEETSDQSWHGQRGKNKGKTHWSDNFDNSGKAVNKFVGRGVMNETYGGATEKVETDGLSENKEFLSTERGVKFTLAGKWTKDNIIITTPDGHTMIYPRLPHCHHNTKADVAAAAASSIPIEVVTGKGIGKIKIEITF